MRDAPSNIQRLQTPVSNNIDRFPNVVVDPAANSTQAEDRAPKVSETYAAKAVHSNVERDGRAGLGRAKVDFAEVFLV